MARSDLFYFRLHASSILGLVFGHGIKNYWIECEINKGHNTKVN